MRSLFYNDWEASHIPEILKEIYTDKIYNPYFLGKKDLTILDLGANIGLTTQYFSQFGKVYSVEPAKETFECLKKLIETNGLNAVPIQCAISTTNGETTFYHNNNNITANSLFKELQDGDTEIVKTRTLGELFKENAIEHIDFMKIDIEGEEFNVFGHDSFDEVADKIDVIMGETHAWAGRNPGQIYQALQNRGFKVKRVSTDANVFYAER
jgi:FkbM family methyltransferase